MRQIKDSDLVGKKIKSINNERFNVSKITFDDDTMVQLWADTAVYTLSGEIPGIFIEDDINQSFDDVP